MYCHFILNSDWQILENSSKTFNDHHSKFNQYFYPLNPLFLDEFPRKSVSVMSQNYKICDWISFPGFGLAHDPILNKKVLICDWISFQEFGLAHAPEFANKV